jgi:hypothetical protein
MSNGNEILKELETTCTGRAREIEAVAAGRLRRCEDCGNTYDINDRADGGKCPHCSAVADIDDSEKLSMFDLFEDSLDVTYTVGANKKYLHGTVCLGIGGPNIFVDTNRHAVCGYWGTDEYRARLTKAAVDAVDDMLAEMYNN